MWPIVYDEDNKKNYDLPSRLLKDRIILVSEEINDVSAMSIVAQLLYLDMENHQEPITMYINSPGGSVSAGFSIYDTMKNIQAPVHTICNGMAASMGAFLLCAGDRRFAMPNSTIMIHQPLGGVQGQATEIEIVAKRINKLKQKLYEIMAEHSGQEYKKIAEACERDNYLEPEQAKEMGLIDEIIPPKKGARID